MPKILLLTRHERLGASSRIRFLQFLPALERQGFTFDVHPFFNNAYVRSLYGGPPAGFGSIINSFRRRLDVLSKRANYDLIWLAKEALPWLPAWLELPRMSGVPYVVDLDDAWFHRYETHWLWPLLGRKIDAVMRSARCVVAGNDYLAARARKAGAGRIKIVQTAIDLDRYRNLPSTPNQTMTVGWIGIPLNAHYLTIIEQALRTVAGESSMRLHVVGASPPPELAGVPAESHPWSEDTEVARIAAFDVGIMPLYDAPWERGKCAYKLLQVMAAGKAVIASPVGANVQVVQHGVNGFLADTVEAWASALRKLAANPDLRRRMGAEARKTVEEHYSTAVIGPRLGSILKEAAASQGP
jgi:glycosyltransferase involved in cell wall biosynthesis